MSGEVGAIRDDASVLAALRPYVVGDCLVAFDAPLVVASPHRPAAGGRRTGLPTIRGRRIRPAPKKKPSLPTFHARRPAGRQLALDMDPLSSATRRTIEVYPLPSCGGAVSACRALSTKAKPGRSVDLLKSELLRLMDGVENSPRPGFGCR